MEVTTEKETNYTYVKKGSVPPIEILHVVSDIAKYLHKEYRAFLVNVGQEA